MFTIYLQYFPDFAAEILPNLCLTSSPREWKIGDSWLVIVKLSLNFKLEIPFQAPTLPLSVYSPVTRDLIWKGKTLLAATCLVNGSRLPPSVNVSSINTHHLVE